MDLGAWNRRLDEHFGALSRDRGDIPLFALEHGLALEEVQALSDALRAHVFVRAPAREHALVWTVYAAEIGYLYAGGEYWQTFEEKTPRWTANGDRAWIRDVFERFQRDYSGAQPSGPWAAQFSIIAWPITHAILPRDLQAQLARVLYYMRDSFSGELFDEPERLGDLIAARSWNASARFQNLVQAPKLVGQIAAALLLQGKDGSRSLLHPAALKRIGDDVDRERRERDWLRDARREAERRVKIRGVTIGESTSAAPNSPEEARKEAARLGIEPSLALRPIDGSRWEVSLEIPDLSHLLLRFPHVRGVLADSRCTVAGAAGRPLARGRCLNGPQRVALARWPRPNEVLLGFERQEPQLDFLLRTECLLRPGGSWLFRVASDGLAYEARGMRVRPGSRYVLVSAQPLPASGLARPVEVTCTGMHAVLLDLPDALTLEWGEVLRQLQVGQAKSIEVWPAGLAAVAWDGEGRGEWLASETPTLAIRSDHPIEVLTIAMGDRGPPLSLSLSEVPLGEPVFIELPSLPVGLNRFSVAARGRSDDGPDVIAELDIVMRVRAARPWSRGATTQGPLQIELEPSAPTLEQLWEGTCSLAVHGPVLRPVRCRVKLFARGSVNPMFEGEVRSLRLPVSTDAWRRGFAASVANNKAAARAYDEAHACEVELSAEELGLFSVRCEREFTPLRWSLRHGRGGITVRLHDHAGSGMPVMERFSFEQPDLSERLPDRSEHVAPHAGGLYVAALGDFRAAIIVPPASADLADLRCEPLVAATNRTSESVVRLVTVAGAWGGARLSGGVVAEARRRLVVLALATRIAALVGGERRGRGEEGRLRDDRSVGGLRLADPQDAVLARGGAPAPSPGLIFPQDVLVRLAHAPLEERGQAFVELVRRYNLLPGDEGRPDIADQSPDAADPRDARCANWLAEFALRLVSDPTTVEAWAGPEVGAGVKRLLRVPAVANAARFLVLAVEQMHGAPLRPGEVYSGWGWPR